MQRSTPLKPKELVKHLYITEAGNKLFVKNFCVKNSVHRPQFKEPVIDIDECNYINPEGITAVGKCLFGNTEKLSELLSLGASPNISFYTSHNSTPFTPLEYSALSHSEATDRIALIDLLLKHGAQLTNRMFTEKCKNN